MELSNAPASVLRDDYLSVDIDRFQGPLDLLLHLIRTQDIDVFDIPISKITEQFLLAVEGVQAHDLDQAGEFLEMAAALVRIKAQMLLPRHGDDESEDPRADLVRRLLEFEQTREISQRLSVAEAERGRQFGKGFILTRPRPEIMDTPLEVTFEELFETALAIQPPRIHTHDHRVTTRAVAMEDKINLILGTLDRVTRIEFSRLVKPFASRLHGVMTFLAGLELTRRRDVRLRQVRPFAELWVYRGEEGVEGVAGGEDLSVSVEKDAPQSSEGET